MWTFESPGFFALLLLVPVLVWFRHFRPGRGGTIRFALDSWRGGHFSPPVTSMAVLVFLLNLAFWAGFILLVLALCGPVETRRERVYLNRGIDIMMVVDISPSMAAQDLAGRSRLDQARDTIKTFVRKRENDPVGLIAFANEAQLRVPPTLDYRSLEAGLDRLQVMTLGEGTAIGLGLSLAAVHLKNSTAGEKIVILLTDGENNAGEITPDMAAGILSGLGIRVYTVGIGSGEEVPLEYLDPRTKRIYRGVYKGRFDEELLKHLARQTGGQYYSARSPGVLESSLQAIDALEKVENRVRIQIIKASLVNVFLLLALGLLCLDALIRRIVVKELS